MTIRLRRMKVVARFVPASVITPRTGHDVVGVEVALAFGQILEEVNRPATLLARDHDVPRALLRFYHRGPSAFCRVKEIMVQA
jgi:hypothetical protein